MKKCVFIILMYPLIEGYGQWKVITLSDTITEYLASIRDDYKHGLKKGFYFPEYLSTDTVLNDGYKLFFKKKLIDNLERNSALKVWQYRLNKTIHCHYDSTYLYQRLYAKNISSYDILLCTNGGVWYKKSFKVDYDYYQIPVRTRISEWMMYKTDINTGSQNKFFVNPDLRQNTLDKIAIIIHKKNSGEKSELVIGEFEIYNEKIIDRELMFPFFEEIQDKPVISNVRYNAFSKETGLPVSLSSFPYYCFYETSGNMRIVGTDSTFKEEDVLYKILRQCIYKYPFYGIGELNEGIVKNKIERLSNYKDEGLIDSLSVIVSLFNDPHFYITKKGVTSSNLYPVRPIQAVYLNNDFYVGAVFDTSLIKSIKPGMKILYVDGIPIRNKINELSINYKGSSEVRRSKALSQLFNKHQNDSTRLCLLSDICSNDTIKITLFYKNKIIIPQKYSPVHMSFYNISSSTSYLRINQWSLGSYIRFLNYYPVLKKKKTLIIDLRNNPGGDEKEVIRFASCFITQPEIFCTTSYQMEEANIKESLVIYPNTAKNLSHIKILFLVNERTTCGSEIFISFIKTRSSGLVIGSSNTAGAYAYAYKLTFPSGLEIVFDSACKPYTTDKVIIGSSGIEPDIWVHLREIKDFAPYEDKILKVARTVAESPTYTK